jgi:uncharacterized protein (DUF697 family)
VAAVPVPMVDVGADVAIMLELLPAINRKYGLSYEQIEQLDSAIKGKILVIISSIGSHLIGRVITKRLVVSLLKKIGTKITLKQATKYVPIFGQAVSAGISFAAMNYLGNSHADECYNVCKQIIEMEKSSGQIS